jgi:hypothetical protein
MGGFCGAGRIGICMKDKAAVMSDNARAEQLLFGGTLCPIIDIL